ncbi:GNAT family N-acetyltransferase [Roseibium algae]|uniref:GNAT family N-acetyltransferase n=1 Tax=Roseibium algae TaxID=3123038 RepID=A0ABU8TMA8_9HYPH
MSFEAFGARELHDLLKLRQDVFVVEQECAFPEIDGKDPDGLHYLLKDSETGALAGALRLFLPEDRANERCRIGRVVIAQAYRGRGLGQQLMEAGIARSNEAAPEAQIDLSAQAHLEPFYKRLGFQTVSDVYLEDDIPHLDMVLSAYPVVR